MKVPAQSNSNKKMSMLPQHVSMAAAFGVLLFLIILHIVSPEFDPSWRMVSEYANGNYSWILSLMFISWAISSWVLAFAISPQLTSRGGRIGLGLLIFSGVGEAMASIFDINHSLHSVSAFIGIGSLPFAAILLSRNLSSVPAWNFAKKILMRTAHLTWISVVLMAVSFALLIHTYIQSGGDISSGAVSEIPEGVIAVVGWANRLLIIVYCAWLLTVAGIAKKVLLKK